MANLLLENFDDKLHTTIKIEALKRKLQLKEMFTIVVKEWINTNQIKH